MTIALKDLARRWPQSRRLSLAFLLLLLWSPGIFRAETAQQTSFRKRNLDNGLQVICERDDSSALTVIQIAIKGGKLASPPGKEGLAHLATRITLEIPDESKVRAMMKQASRFSSECSGDYSVNTIECLTENLEETWKIVSKSTLKPLISGLRVDAITKSMLELGRVEQDEPAKLGQEMAFEAFFGKSGYGGPALGSQESLDRLKPSDAADFHKRHFTAGNVFLVVSSDLDPEKLEVLLAKTFQGLKKGIPEPEAEVVLPAPAKKDWSIEKETKQIYLASVFPLPHLSARNYVLAFLLEDLLGGGIGSKLWPLRTELDLAYNVSCEATQWKRGGILEAYLETDVTKKDQAVLALKKVLLEIQQNGISVEDFESTRAHAKSQFLRSMETKRARTRLAADFEALGLGYEFLNTLFLETDAVDLEEFNSYLREILDPEKAVSIAVGPTR